MNAEGLKKAIFYAGILIAVFAILWCFSTVNPFPGKQTSTPPVLPVYEDGFWKLGGIVQDGILHKTLLGESLDLLQVRYGSRKLWAVAGIHNPDGSYESLVSGLESPEELRSAFLSSRAITLQVPGTPEYIDSQWCQNTDSTRCRLTQLVEASGPALLLEGQEQYTNGLSNVFIHSGNFPEHYLYGFLTWQIEPGKYVQPEWKGKW